MITRSPGLIVGVEQFLDIGSKAIAIDRTVDEPWRLDAVVTKRRRRLPPVEVCDLYGSGCPGDERV